MEKRYFYPATLKNCGNCYHLEFVDFPDATPVEEIRLEEVLKSAKDVLALNIVDYMAENRGKVPRPSFERGNVTIDTTLEGVKTFMTF